MPGRPQRRALKRKQAASTCYRLDKFIKSADTESAEQGSPATAAAASSSNTTVEESLTCREISVGDVESDAEVSNEHPFGNTESSNRVEPSAQKEIAAHSNDIGHTYQTSPSGFLVALNSLTSAQKYSLLTNHKKTHKHFKFPTTYIGGCNRSFRLIWLEQHPWMVCSEAVDGIFCIFCALFSSLETPRGSFVSQPFRLWNKKGEKAKQHEKCAYHQSAVDKATSFRHSIENPESTITAQVYSCKARNIRNNRAVLMSIASAILYCSRQCIALRGDAEDGKSSENPGNWLALLRLLAQHNEVLRNHLEAPAMRSATHLSPHTQNELIGVMGKHIILKGIVDELNTAKFFAILADEVTSHNVEHLAIWARFVDLGKNVREEFLAFIKLERITGEKVAEGILEFLKQNDIPVGNICGQGYDEASNMASQRVGVQARIRQEAPLAVYVHCSAHCLNLVISKSCSLPQVRNVMDRLLQCSRFFLYPKRMGILEMIVKHNIIDSANRKPVLDLCQTRWAEHYSAFQHFYQSFVFIVEALKMIAYRHHLEK